MKGDRRDIVTFEVVWWLDSSRSDKPIKRQQVCMTMPRAIAQAWPKDVNLVKPKEADW